MDDTVLVQMLKSLTRLPRNRSNLAFCHQIGGNDVCERTSFHVFHDYPKVILVQEGINIVDDVGVSRGTHDENLVDDQILLGLFIEVHLFDGHGHVRTNLVRCVDTSRRTARKQNEDQY